MSTCSWDWSRQISAHPSIKEASKEHMNWDHINSDLLPSSSKPCKRNQLPEHETQQQERLSPVSEMSGATSKHPKDNFELTFLEIVTGGKYRFIGKSAII